MKKCEYEEDLNKRIGEKIRKLRKDKKITLKEISNILGLSLTQYRKFEIGKSKITVARLIKIAIIFRTDIYEFINVLTLEETLRSRLDVIISSPIQRLRMKKLGIYNDN